jgi:hypothetical protein
MGLDGLGRAVGRYGVRTLAWLFVVIGPATVPAVDHPQPAGVDRLDDRYGADGSDPEHYTPTLTPPPSPQTGG